MRGLYSRLGESCLIPTVFPVMSIGCIILARSCPYVRFGIFPLRPLLALSGAGLHRSIANGIVPLQQRSLLFRVRTVSRLYTPVKM